MNSGVGDAIDLSWKLAATLQGWGGPDLLASYEVERRQIGDRNVEASRQASRGRRAWRAHVAAQYPRQHARGRGDRAPSSPRIADVEQRKSNEMIGAELGYRYGDSPIICRMPGEARSTISANMCRRPGRARGCRMSGSTTARRCTTASATATRCCGSAARGRYSAAGRRFATLWRAVDRRSTSTTNARAVYGYDLLLLRPDLHVVWRGNAPPDDPAKSSPRLLRGTKPG